VRFRVRCRFQSGLSSHVTAGPSPAGGQWCPAPPYKIGAPPFHVWLLGCCIHLIPYFKNVAPLSGFWPLLLVFLDPPAAKSWRRACVTVTVTITQVGYTNHLSYSLPKASWVKKLSHTLHHVHVNRDWARQSKTTVTLICRLPGITVCKKSKMRLLTFLKGRSESRTHRSWCLSLRRALFT